jgi:hypothetical protein
VASQLMAYGVLLSCIELVLMEGLLNSFSIQDNSIHLDLDIHYLYK